MLVQHSHYKSCSYRTLAYEIRSSCFIYTFPSGNEKYILDILIQHTTLSFCTLSQGDSKSPSFIDNNIMLIPLTKRLVDNARTPLDERYLVKKSGNVDRHGFHCPPHSYLLPYLPSFLLLYHSFLSPYSPVVD